LWSTTFGANIANGNFAQYPLAVAQEDKSPDPAWWSAWRGIVFAHSQVFHAVERDLKQHSGIPLPFLDVLGRLYDAPGGRLRMQELQQRSLFTHSGITRLADRIEAAGLLRREQVPGDRRGVSVVITPEGMQVYAAAIARHRSDVERAFASRLTPAQHETVAEALWPFWHE
jgi:DNA-binding MarR family transcriptional regulator